MTSPLQRQAPGNDFLSRAQLKALTPQQVIDRMRALRPALLEGAAQAEAQRRPIDALWNEIRASGYFYMWIPKKFGGLEATVDEVVDATLPIAEGCPSTAWLASFGLVHNRHQALASEEFQEEIFGGGRYGIVAAATMPPGKAERTKGGYLVSGRWQWSTLCVQADWIQGVALVDGPDGPTGGSFLIPASECEIIDTWKTDGMCATGTHDVVAKDVFVPEHRASFVQSRDGKGRGAELYENPIYRVPLSPLLAFTTAVPVVGAARGAVNLYKERLLNHTKRGTAVQERDRQSSQIRLARAETMVSVAEQTVRSAMNENLTGDRLSGDEQIAFRSRLRAQMTFAAQLSRSAVQTVCESTGTSIHYTTNPLQRFLRDMMVMTSHVIFDDDVTMEQHGRAMLGMPLTTIIS